MNKKIIALAMVPILIGMTGVFAFSAYTGNSNVALSTIAGNLAFNQYVYYWQTNASSTPMSVIGNQGTLNSPNHGVAVDISGSGAHNAALSYITARYFEPGTYIMLEVYVTNTGTGSIQFTSGASYVGFSGSLGYAAASSNGPGSTSGSFQNLLVYGSGAQWVYYAQPITGTVIGPGQTAHYFVLVGLSLATGNNGAGTSAFITVSTDLGSHQ